MMILCRNITVFFDWRFFHTFSQRSVFVDGSVNNRPHDVEIALKQAVAARVR